MASLYLLFLLLRLRENSTSHPHSRSNTFRCKKVQLGVRDHHRSQDYSSFLRTIPFARNIKLIALFLRDAGTFRSSRRNPRRIHHLVPGHQRNFVVPCFSGHEARDPMDSFNIPSPTSFILSYLNRSTLPIYFLYFIRSSNTT